MIAVLLYVIAGLMVVGALFRIAYIGKPLGTLKPRSAVISTVISAAYVTVLVLAATQLQGVS